jgi:hypothetical protein
MAERLVMNGRFGMERWHVSSATIRSIGYDPERRTLEVESRSGSVYQYYQVPGYLYEGLLKAGSKGSFLESRIKKGSYVYRRLV